VILPDLHPINVPKPHETPAELEKVVLAEFETAIRQKNYMIQDYRERFRVFCFKYDLEALVLAAEEALAAHLGVRSLKVTWMKPVEDQNKDHPPSAWWRNYFGLTTKNIMQLIPQRSCKMPIIR
jgi:hypothetical protein